MDELRRFPVTPETRQIKPKTAEELAQRARVVDWVAFIALTSLSLTVYVRTLCPTIFTDDCGEIATAVATGGVIHPPGYPLYTLLGQLFLNLFDIGEPAWRLGLLSCVCGSLSVGVAYLLSRKLGATTIWAAAASCAFAFSVTLWQQSTKVETYTLNALLIGLVWLFAARYDESPTLKRLCVFAFFCGLALTNHLTSICAIIGGAVLVAMNLRQSKTSPTLSVITAVIVGALPLSLYSLIWINAATHPDGQIWGNPSNWRGLYLHLTGARYHAYFTSQNALDMAQRDLVNLPAILWHNMGPVLVLVIPGAGRALWADGTRRHLTLALLISCSAYLVETTVYGILNIFEYYTPVVMILCVFAGVGADALFKELKKLPVLSSLPAERAIASICLAVTLMSALIIHWPYCDRSNATFIRNMALDTLNSLPQNSVLIATGDNRVFPMWYAQDVLGVRRDVTLVPRHTMDALTGSDGVLMMGWLVNKLAGQHADVVDRRLIFERAEADSKYARSEGPTWDIAVNALSQNLPVFMTDAQPLDTHVSPEGWRVLNPIGPNLILSPYGLVDQIMPQSAYKNIRVRSSINMALLNHMSFSKAPDALMQDEPDGNITNDAYSAMLTRDADMVQKAGSEDSAYRILSQAIQIEPTAQRYDSLAQICSNSLKPLEALHYMQMAVNLDPNNDDLKTELKYAQALAANRASHIPQPSYMNGLPNER